MEKTEYIEFDIHDKKKFDDLLKVYKLISESKKTQDFNSEKFWLKVFPNYSLRHYYFLETDIKPEFETTNSDHGTWHFYSMIEHLIENLDVQLLECKKVDTKKGRLNFYSNGYPYGGVSGLTMFLNSFEQKATKIDEGGGVYKVEWKNETEFELKKYLTCE